MIVLEFLGAIVLMWLILFVPLYILYRLVKLFWETFIEPPAPVVSSAGYPQSQRITYQSAELLLSLKFSYFQRLDDAGRARFLKRLLRFISEKEFRAMSGMMLTEEMVVLISASAIQLTFGLDDYLLEHFTSIFIYPREFYSRINKTYNKGETNAGGAIALSWKDFREGYADEHNNLNLGLHEMAHALRFNELHDDFDSLFAAYMSKWRMMADGEFEKLKAKQPSFFRAYGGSNISEFFSVCVEYFFESPKEFKEHLPDLYRSMTTLLNQDPSTAAGGRPFTSC